MLLLDAGLLDRVEIVASDISLRALERAQSGRFGRRSVRDHVSAEPRRWLGELPNGEWTVPSRIAAAIQWRRVNLCDPVEVAAIGACDVIFCRNVLIYFSDL